MIGFLKKAPGYPTFCDIRDRYRKSRLARTCLQWTAEDERRKTFYAQFVRPGDTVFDVGANMGNRTRTFLRLGAKVVAVEPQSRCADILAIAFGKNPSFRLERKALGGAPGEAEMLICRANTISSLSPDWVHSVQASGRFGSLTWDGKEQVAIDTLDHLIATHGRPSFVKIDVEGFEYEVISGLTSPVRAMSLEFTQEYLEQTFRCVDHLAQFPGVRYQMSMFESLEFSLPGWVPTDEIRKQLKALAPMAVGDLYVMCDV